MSIFINILHFIQIPGSLFNIFKTIGWVCEKKKDIEKSSLQKVFSDIFHKLALIF